MKNQTQQFANSQQPESIKRTLGRGAFTLIELVVVILIIGILMAFIFPAITRAITAARNASVVSEIKSLEAAISAFEQEYGVEPPSRIVLFEDAAGWLPGNLSSFTAGQQQQIRESRAILTRMWPDIDFLYGGTAAMPGSYDIDGDGEIRVFSDGPLLLTGAECLVFFLGGMSATEDGGGNSIVDANGMNNAASPPVLPEKWAMLGFSSNPRQPFSRGGSRVGPFHEFDSARLVNINTPDPTSDRKLPEYVDTLPGQIAPYIYLSSYQGRGYNVLPGSPPTAYSDVDLGPSSLVGSPLYPYLESDPDGPTNADVTNDIPYNAKSYQIISPGYDNEYGVGGLYDKDQGFDGNREFEKDNITNFAGGVLDAS